MLLGWRSARCRELEQLIYSLTRLSHRPLAKPRGDKYLSFPHVAKLDVNAVATGLVARLAVSYRSAERQSSRNTFRSHVVRGMSNKTLGQAKRHICARRIVYFQLCNSMHVKSSGQSYIANEITDELEEGDHIAAGRRKSEKGWVRCLTHDVVRLKSEVGGRMQLHAEA